MRTALATLLLALSACTSDVATEHPQPSDAPTGERAHPVQEAPRAQ